MPLRMRTLSCFPHLSVFPRHHGDEPTWRHDRRLTLLGSVEPTFVGKPTIHNRSNGLSLALRLHKLKNVAADSAACISTLMVGIANPAS
jgi:hypothetical protein